MHPHSTYLFPELFDAGKVARRRVGCFLTTSHQAVVSVQLTLIAASQQQLFRQILFMRVKLLHGVVLRGHNRRRYFERSDCAEAAQSGVRKTKTLWVEKKRRRGRRRKEGGEATQRLSASSTREKTRGGGQHGQQR